MDIIIRPIEQRDNKKIADIIKTVCREYKVDWPGTVYTDPTTNDLYQLFKTYRSAYWVAKEMLSNLIRTRSYSTYIIILALMFLYRLICILLFSRTIGMMICRVKYLNSSLHPLISKEKLIAVFAIRTSAIRYYKVQ